MQIGLLLIGDELLSGRRQDRHLAHAIDVFQGYGLQLSWAYMLPDDDVILVDHLRQTLPTEACVFGFGGIGATPDDLTRQSVARAAGVDLVRHPDAVAQIEAQYGEAAYPNRILMAELPAGSTIIPNPINRVPGFRFRQHHFLPGFPEMAWPMMRWVLAHHYPMLEPLPYLEQSVLVQGAPESELLDLMQSIHIHYPQVKLFSLPRLRDEGRGLELGVKGDPATVKLALSVIKEALTQRGYQWSSVE